jgi:hypothetical protein
MFRRPEHRPEYLMQGPRNVREGRGSSRTYTKPRALGGGRPGLGPASRRRTRTGCNGCSNSRASAFALSLRVMFQVLRIRRKRRDPIAGSDLPAWMRPNRRCQIGATHISFNDRVRPTSAIQIYYEQTFGIGYLKRSPPLLTGSISLPHTAATRPVSPSEHACLDPGNAGRIRTQGP